MECKEMWGWPKMNCIIDEVSRIGKGADRVHA